MSIRKQIDSYIQDVTTQGDEVTAKVCFAKDFIGFQGHFPQNPILPGICLLETVLVLLHRLKGKSIHMSELVNSKFFTVIVPDQVVDINCKLDGETVIANIKIETKRIANIKMKVSFA